MIICIHLPGLHSRCFDTPWQSIHEHTYIIYKGNHMQTWSMNDNECQWWKAKLETQAWQHHGEPHFCKWQLALDAPSSCQMSTWSAQASQASQAQANCMSNSGCSLHLGFLLKNLLYACFLMLMLLGCSFPDHLKSFLKTFWLERHLAIAHASGGGSRSNFENRYLNVFDLCLSDAARTCNIMQPATKHKT